MRKSPNIHTSSASNSGNYNNNTNLNNINIHGQQPSVKGSGSEIFFNNIMRMQNMTKFSSPMNTMNDSIVGMNNLNNPNQRNNLIPNHQININPNVNKGNFMSNPNMNIISNFGNVSSQMNNNKNRINPNNLNNHNQPYMNYMVPLIDNNTNLNSNGANNLNMNHGQKNNNFNFQMTNVRNFFKV